MPGKTPQSQVIGAPKGNHNGSHPGWCSRLQATPLVEIVAAMHAAAAAGDIATVKRAFTAFNTRGARAEAREARALLAALRGTPHPGAPRGNRNGSCPGWYSAYAPTPLAVIIAAVDAAVVTGDLVTLRRAVRVFRIRHQYARARVTRLIATIYAADALIAASQGTLDPTLFKPCPLARVPAEIG